MALFVPILRLIMLFLNVYDSYKTLKDPPASSRNAGRPSVRAMSQRKRDMKGCLAVWIVFASLTMYERSVESIVSLFIPFYDEFKSLLLLFLILTRARGAEPIYLHLIRPLVKPYTRTLDGTLDLMLMVGDFIFALSTYPIRLAVERYRNHYGSSSMVYVGDSDSESSNDVNTSEVPTSFIASSSHIPFEGRSNPRARTSRTSSEDQPHTRTPPTRHSSDDIPSSRNASRKTTMEVPERPLSPRRKSSRGSVLRENGTNSSHQIWHPPTSSHMDDVYDSPDTSDIPPNEGHSTALAQEQQLFEEWRQYPAFPSAYPPTPVAPTSRLVNAPNLVSPSTYPPIDEDNEESNNNQQDFVGSLLPPREPLNPNHARDLSDKHNILGITSTSSPSEVEDADDSMSASDDEYEDEDDFNITLRTPLRPMGSFKSQIPAQRLLPITTTLSASSSITIPSRSSALTTAVDDKSAAPIATSSDSSLSSRPETNTLSVLGKKRALPRTKTQVVRNRVRQIEDHGASSRVPESESSHGSELIMKTTLKPENDHSSSSSLPIISKESTVESSNDNDNDGHDALVESQEQIPPEEKRRKIVRAIPTRVVRPVHPVRPRVARHTSPPSKSPTRKSAGTAQRTSVRGRASVRPSVGTRGTKTQQANQSSSRTGGDSSAALTSDNSGDNGPVRKTIKRMDMKDT
ncbi:hypothetical protein D9613_004800 [Agrocybe pediades]|uniref:Protein YOP1 n=1 Tax=Agrocybe pediades TaxID=84607 RepID=A0A8H4VQJ4_9AGAR|nr:hypothetical protein D9613_004800 [Agrocybe pediades]